MYLVFALWLLWIWVLSVDAVDLYMYIYVEWRCCWLLHVYLHSINRVGAPSVQKMCGSLYRRTESLYWSMQPWYVIYSADNAYNVLCLPMVSYCKFIYILLFSSAMHSLICYSSNPWTPTITAQWSHSADGRRISCWWSASCLSRLHITTNTEQRNFCLSCQSSRSVLHSNLLEFKFCSSLKSV